MEVTLIDEFIVDDTFAAEFQAGFLARVPIRMIRDPASTIENPLPYIPEFTSKQHLRREIIKWGMRVAQQGHKVMAGRTATILQEDALT